MAPQLTKLELDRAFLHLGKGATPVEIHAKLRKSRALREEDGPDVTSVRRALRGSTHKRGRKETRGRKPSLSVAQIRRLEPARVALIEKAENEGEAHLCDAMRRIRYGVFVCFVLMLV